MTPRADDSPEAIVVVQSANGTRTLQFSTPEVQSSMLLLNPDALDLEYTRIMMGFLMFNAQPALISMIGLGGGSLAKFCYRHLPSSRIEAVEISPEVIALRDEFRIPPDDARFRIVQGDGADYAASAAVTPDVLLVDGFDASGMPEQLCSQAFYDDCLEMLAPDGILVVNLHINKLHPVCVERIRNSFGTAVFEVIDDDDCNSIIFACKGDSFDRPEGPPLRRPAHLGKDAWRQLMPALTLVATALELR